jgi:hypothetical protein
VQGQGFQVEHVDQVASCIQVLVVLHRLFNAVRGQAVVGPGNAIQLLHTYPHFMVNRLALKAATGKRLIVLA